MKNAVIRLSTISDVKKFVTIANNYTYDIDLLSGRYVIDAKSIMGIFSLDLSQPITIQVDCGDDNSFFEEIQAFIVKK